MLFSGCVIIQESMLDRHEVKRMPICAAFAVPHPPIILPEIGHGEEKKIKKTIDAYREVMQRAASYQPDTVVVTSPHTVMYADYFHISPGERAGGDFGQFGAPQVKMHAVYDTAFVEALMKCCGEENLPAGTFGEQNPELDHGTMIPLRFLQEKTGNFKLVRIGLSGLSPLAHYRLGQCIARTAEKLNRKVVLIASGDLSHKLKTDGPYGFAAEGPEFDRMAVEAFRRGDFLSLLEMDADFCEAAAECGLRSYWIMAGALDRKAVRSEVLSYEGPFGVGYCVASFEVTGEDRTRNFGEQAEVDQKRELAQQKAAEDSYVRLARLSVETYVRTGARASLPEKLPPEMTGARAGVFVSLKEDERLRGCIGTIEPETPSIAEEILCNAVSACSRDPRFDPVGPEELDRLVYSVDVLQQPESIDSMQELDVKKYGVIVASGRRRGLLLPNLAGVDTPEKQVTIAREKAGIAAGEPVHLQRFQVVRHL